LLSANPRKRDNITHHRSTEKKGLEKKGQGSTSGEGGRDGGFPYVRGGRGRRGKDGRRRRSILLHGAIWESAPSCSEDNGASQALKKK